MAQEFRQVLTELGGEVGDRKRKNLDALRERVSKELAPGGPVDKEIGELLTFTYSAKE